MKKIILVSFLITLLVLIAFLPYDWASHRIAFYFIPPEKHITFLERYFTPSRFLFLKGLVISVLFFCGIVFVYIKKIREWLLGEYKLFLEESRELLIQFKEDYLLWDKSTRYGLWFTLLFVTSIQIYFAISYPIHIDEAFSYVFFASKGLTVSAVFYPGPNNHVGYTLWVALLSKFLPASWAIRLPVLLQACVATLAGYTWLANRYGTLTAMVSILLFTLSEYGLFYAVHGRGYWAVAFCTFIMLWAIESQYQTPYRRIYYVIGIVAAIYGFYSVPVFLYPFIGVSLWGVWRISAKNFEGLQNWLIALFIVFIITSLLYLPILLFNDWHTLTANPWVLRGQESFWKDYFSYLIEVNAAFYGTEKIGFAVVLLCWLLAFIGIFIPSYRSISMLIICLGVLPFVLIIFQKVLPFTRVWLYKSVVEYVFIGIFLGYLAQKNHFLRYGVVALLVCGSLFQLHTHHTRLHQDKGIYVNAQNCAKRIMQENPTRVFANHDLYQVMLRYEAVQIPISFDIETKTLDNTADIVIANNKNPLSVSGKLIWRDDEVSVYKRE